MPRDTWSKWHRIYSVNLILYKSSDLKPLSQLEVLGEFAKNRFGKNFPVAVFTLISFKNIFDNTNPLGAIAWSVAMSLGNQEAPRSILASGTSFREDLVMKLFLRPFFLFRLFKKSSCQLMAKGCSLSII